MTRQQFCIVKNDVTAQFGGAYDAKKINLCNSLRFLSAVFCQPDRVAVVNPALP